ncbi:hypothetical protein G3A39_42180 [Paraburkholderia aspalathi]|nr:hypothetical protein [Paraburkholderia aspalathi]
MLVLLSLSASRSETRWPYGVSVPGPDPGEGEQAKGNQTVLVVVFLRVAVNFMEIEGACSHSAEWLPIADNCPNKYGAALTWFTQLLLDPGVGNTLFVKRVNCFAPVGQAQLKNDDKNSA